MEDNDLPDAGDIIFVEVTVTDPSDFESALVEVFGEVLHDVYRVIKLRVSDRAQRSCCPAAGDPRCDRVRPHIYFEWTEGNPASNFLRFLFFGSARSLPSPGRFFARRSPAGRSDRTSTSAEQASGFKFALDRKGFDPAASNTRDAVVPEA